MSLACRPTVPERQAAALLDLGANDPAAPDPAGRSSSSPEWGAASNGAEDDAAAAVDGRCHGTDEPHRTFGHQIHGPSALGVGSRSRTSRFSSFDELTVAGIDPATLRHSVSADAGFDFRGPREESHQRGSEKG